MRPEYCPGCGNKLAKSDTKKENDSYILKCDCCGLEAVIKISLR